MKFNLPYKHQVHGARKGQVLTKDEYFIGLKEI